MTLARLLLPILLLASPALGDTEFYFDSQLKPNGTHLGELRVFLHPGTALQYATVDIVVPPEFIEVYEVVPNVLLDAVTGTTFPTNLDTGLQTTRVQYHNHNGNTQQGVFLAATLANVDLIEKGTLNCEYQLVGDVDNRYCEVRDISFRGAVPVPLLGSVETWGLVGCLLGVGYGMSRIWRRREG